MTKRSSYIDEKISTRQLLVDVAARLGNRIPHIYSVWEMDIFPIRQELKAFNNEYKTKVSLYTFLMYAYVYTVKQNIEIQSIISSQRKKRTYKSIDVFFPIELPNNELRLHIARDCEHKTLIEIQEELEFQMKRTPQPLPWNVRLYLKLPRVIKYWISDLSFRFPKYRKELYGTAYFTAMKTVANIPGKGFGFPLPLNSIGMLVANLYRPEGSNQNMISITNSADHRLINGTQLTKFCSELKKNIEDLIQKENWSKLHDGK